MSLWIKKTIDRNEFLRTVREWRIMCIANIVPEAK